MTTTTRDADAPARLKPTPAGESRAKRALSAAKCAYDRFLEHRSDLLGTALAFYTLLAIAPLLIVVLAILGWIYGAGEAHNQAIHAVRDLLGTKAGDMAGDWLTQTSEFSSAASVIGILLFLFGASRVFAQLTSALDAVWDKKVDTSMSVWASVLDSARRYAIGSAVGLALGVLLGVSTVGHSLLNNFTRAILPSAVIVAWLVHFAYVGLTWVAVTLVFSSLFTLLPHTRPRWWHVLPGSAVAGALFTLGNVLLAEYFQRVDVGVGYGTAGSIVVVLVWLSYSGQIFMYGAELVRVVTERREGVARARKATPTSDA